MITRRMNSVNIDGSVFTDTAIKPSWFGASTWKETMDTRNYSGDLRRVEGDISKTIYKIRRNLKLVEELNSSLKGTRGYKKEIAEVNNKITSLKKDLKEMWPYRSWLARAVYLK